MKHCSDNKQKKLSRRMLMSDQVGFSIRNLVFRLSEGLTAS